jgi:hypothetical protein
MINSDHRPDRWTVALAIVLVCLMTPRAGAQTTPAPADTVATSAMAREIVSFECVEARSQGDVARDVDAAKGDKAAAETELATARQIEISAKGRVEIAKGVRDVTKAQLDLAKKEKRDADVLRLESLKKRQELELKFLGQLAGVRSASVDRAAARKDLAETRQKAYEFELLLLERRAALRSLPHGDPAAPAREKEMREAEHKTLEARSDVAARSKDLADKEKDLADRHVDLCELAGEYRRLP